MTVDGWQPVGQFFLAGHFLGEIIVGPVAFQRRFSDKTAAFNAEVLLRNGERISASDFRYFHTLDSLATRRDEIWICRGAKEVAVEPRLFGDLRSFFQRSACVRQRIKLRHFSRVTE